MSDPSATGGPEPEARPDPLTELRAADARPFAERLSARLRHQLPSAQSSQPPATTGPAVALAVVAVVVLGFVGWRLAHDARPPIEDTIPLAAPVAVASTESAPPASSTGSTEAVVHVAGAVRRPGLVTGESGWRVADAISAAGGATGDADTDRINLARPITDGERIFVPVVGEPIPAVDGSAPDPDGLGPAPPIDLNTATAVELEQLPGVGPATASAIVEHRENSGLFGAVDALVAVRGIGPATLERLRPHVTVG